MKSPDGENDPVALIPLVIAGDRDALDGWFRQERAPVYRICFGFLADSTEAEDLCQDAMVKLMDNLPQWRRERPYRAWRNSIVSNLCRDRLRRRNVRRRAERRAAEEPSPERLPRPEAAAEQGELRTLLTEALLALPEREREVFVLRDLEGVATSEVADSLGIQASSVRSLLTLARRRLRERLAHRLPVGACGDRNGGRDD